MNKHFPFVLIIFFFISCSNNRAKTGQQNPDEQTPGVLMDERRHDTSSFRKRHSQDIIQELFEEAIKNDKALKTVASRLERVYELKLDSLAAYQDYMSNNQGYWYALYRYSNLIRDSTLKRELTGFIETLEDKHENRTEPLNSLIADIDSIERKLRDLEILMKIVVTKPMMSNYQRNEYPNIKTLESVKQALNSSIEEVEPYTKMQK